MIRERIRRAPARAPGGATSSESIGYVGSLLSFQGVLTELVSGFSANLNKCPNYVCRCPNGALPECLALLHSIFGLDRFDRFAAYEGRMQTGSCSSLLEILSVSGGITQLVMSGGG